MASITISLLSSCTAGDHAKIGVTGAVTNEVIIHETDVTAPMSDDEKRIVILGLLKLIRAGKTKAQFITALQTGVVISV